MTYKTQKHKDVEKIVSEVRARNNFRGKISIKEKYDKPCFSGVIKKLENIESTYNPDYPLHDIGPGYSREKSFNSAFESVLEHEVTHKKDGKGRGFPQTEDYDLEKVLIPVANVLKSKGLPNVACGHQGHTLYTYFANLVSDFGVNNIVCDNRGSEGLFLVYNDMLNSSGKLGDLFEGFLKLQARTFSKKKGVSKIIPYFTHNEKPKKAVQNFLSRTKLMEILPEKRADYLANPENYEKISSIFAEEFSELVDAQDLQACFFPVFGGNDFARLNDEEVQMKIAIKAYGKEGSEFKPPVFMDDNLALLSVYKMLAKDIEMKVESHSIETERPVSYVSRRKFDIEKDNVEKMRIGINSPGKLEMQVGKYPLKVRSRYQISAGNFPEIRVGLVDCSDSTRREINGKKGKIMNSWAQTNMQWTDSSIYHYELKNAFGLFELFRRKGTLRRSNTRAGVFSDESRMGIDLSESERLLLQPSFSGTQLDKETIDELFQGRNCLVYLMSDGEIANKDDWVTEYRKDSGRIIEQKVKLIDYFVQKAEGHHVFYLHVGEPNETSNYLDSRGIKVVYDDGTNSNVLVDLTRKEIYGEMK